MYKGYLEFGGTEIANAQRVVDYVRKNAPHIPLNVDVSKHQSLNEALGEEPYDSPAADGAPWIDAADPSTRRFLGIYPIEVSGIDASTRSAATVESIGPGGVTGRVRHGSKAIRVTAMLVAEDALALEAGATWLSRALDSDDCGSASGNCTGSQLCFYAAKPEVCDEWEPTYQAGYARPVAVTEQSSPLILREGGEDIFKAILDEGATSSKEGVVAEWGTVRRDNTNVWDEHYGPVVLRRTNLMHDPNFDAGGAGWSPTTIAAAGGSDGGAYAQVDTPNITLGPLEATNIAQDPSFQAGLGPDLQRTNLDTNPAKVGGGAWVADNMPNGAATYHSDGGPDELPFDTYARYTMTADDDAINGGIRYQIATPTIGGFYAASIWVRFDEAQTVRARWDYVGGTGFTESADIVVPADTWVRVGLVSAAIPAGTTEARFTIGAAATGRIWTLGGTFDHTGALVETRRFVDEFFYGDMADTVDAVYAFTGAVNGSTSTLHRYRAVTSLIGSSRETYRHSAAAREGSYGQRTVATSTASDFTVQMTTQGASITGTHTVTFWVISRNREVTITPRVRGADGTPVAVPAGVWTKISSEVVAGGASSSSTGMRIAGAQIGDIIDADMFTLVAGSYAGDPFTGATPASGGYAYAWSGAANASTSLRYTTIASEYAIDSPTFTAPSGDFIASFALRNLDGSPITVELRADADDSVLGEMTASASEEWDRYSFGDFGGVPMYLHFTGDAPFDLDEVLVEVGRIELPYFDGDTPWEQAAFGLIVGGMDTPEYTVSWAGQPHISDSVMVWEGSMTIGVPFGTDTFALQSGACDVWPRIDVQQGEISGGFAPFALRLKVPTSRQVQPYERTMYDVTCVSGPTPLRDLEFDNGTRMRMVEFILVAGNPFVYGSPIGMIYPAYGTQLGTVPWSDPECPSTELVPVSDPLCPPPPAPPRPPAIAANCVPPETTWERHWFSLPGSSVSAWSEMVPIIKVSADVADVRHLRVRFYPNPFGYGTNATRRVNRVSNTRVDPENGTWGNVASINGAGARVAATMPDGSAGYAWRFTTSATAVAASSGARTSLVSYNLVDEGVPIMLSIYGRTNAARNLKMRYAFYEAETTVQVGSILYADVKAVAANTWARFSALVTPPAGAGRVSISVVADGPDLATGQWVEGTWASAVEEDVLTPFFDGDTVGPPGVYYSWAGERGLSESVELTGIEIDPCSWCAEYVLSYLPGDSEAVIDAALERSTISVAAGEPQPYDTFVVSTGGEPLEWSSMSCGIDYLVAIDFPTGSENQVKVGLDIMRRL